MRARQLEVRAERVEPESLRGLRTRFRDEMRCQIVHDSIHRRPGWTEAYGLFLAGECVGFATVAVGGPWAGKPTWFEFYVRPGQRDRAFDLFECALQASPARWFEVQSNDGLLAAMLFAYGQDIVSEKIVFGDGGLTQLPGHGARLRPLTDPLEVQANLERRQGGGEWALEWEGVEVGRGGILFHYNRPYGDVYMEVAEAHRRRGFGAFLVQELKRCAYELGAIPAARCSPDNVASRQTLQRAGFVPFAHILLGQRRA